LNEAETSDGEERANQAHRCPEGPFQPQPFWSKVFDRASMAEGDEMTKQFLKGFTMLVAILTFAMVSAVASANGQTITAKARVPFEFVVGDKTLPAGDYMISNATTFAMKISKVDSKDVALRLSDPVDGKAGKPRLVFHKYGQRYFLAQVWGYDETGRALAISREERAIRKSQSHIASNKSATPAYELVAVALDWK
jgi:hypothetical protein